MLIPRFKVIWNNTVRCACSAIITVTRCIVGIDCKVNRCIRETNLRYFNPLDRYMSADCNKDGCVIDYYVKYYCSSWEKCQTVIYGMNNKWYKLFTNSNTVFCCNISVRLRRSWMNNFIYWTDCSEAQPVILLSRDTVKTRLHGIQTLCCEHLATIKQDAH